MKHPTATNNEITLDTTVIIVVRTDVNGIITDVNDDFAKVSGYHQNDAIGQHISFIQHPSVPAEIFVDLWKSLSEMSPWSGVVKNIIK